MKIINLLFLGLFVFVLAVSNVFAQSRNLTVILLRHAEKDVSVGADKSDPDLTIAGKQRAERLVEILKKYKPDLIYSTNYKRTKSTVAPLSETIDARYKIPIRIYDFDRLEELADWILKSKARAVLVVGHYDTTPTLANLLVKQEKYKPLDDAEFDKIWIIKIRRYKKKPSKIVEKVIKY